MKKKHSYNEKVKKDNRAMHVSKDTIWILQITLMAFVISLSLSFVSETVIPNVYVFISIIIVFLFIILGIVFDMVGVSATVADAKVFHSMATKRVRSSKTALLLIKNNSKVSSFCCDVIGDICGILSGSAGITIAVSISSLYNINLVVVNLIMTSLIASLTIGGKAVGKSYAINKANKILYRFAKAIDVVTFNRTKKGL